MFYLIKKILDIKWKNIQAKKHKIGTYEIDKISLSCFDDKRFVLDNGINTLVYFHKDCNKKDLMSSISIEVSRTDFVLFFFNEKILSIYSTNKSIEVTFIHTIYTNKSTSSNSYSYNMHK